MQRQPATGVPSGRPLVARLRFWLGQLVLASSLAAAESAIFSPIRVTLVSDQSGIVPGQTFSVALHQKMAPGFHTYWKNPGTVGLPSSIRWKLPPGFKAGTIQWPLPEVCRMAAYRVWGYQTEVLLLTDIAAPAELSLGQPVAIAAEANWMCCGRQCHPGFKPLELILPATATASKNPAWAGKFEQVRQQQPKVFPGWKIACARTGDCYQLSALSAQPLPPADDAAIQFFGFRRQVSSDKPQILRRLPRGYELDLFAEEFAPEEHSRLTGILVSNRGWSADCSQRPMLIDVPIETPNAEREPAARK